jgi:hypothetical protein
VSRAVWAGLSGDTSAVFHFHPLWTFVVVVVGAIFIAEVVSFIRSGRFQDYVGRTILHRAGIGLSVLLFLLWAIRFVGAFAGPSLSTPSKQDRSASPAGSTGEAVFR